MRKKTPAAGRAPAEHRDEVLRDFSRSLPMALLRAREAVLARFRPMLREHDLTDQQWRVLRALAASTTPLRFSEIAQMTFLSLPSLSRLLKTLESRELVHRMAHQTDLRAAQISLTSEGKRLVERVAPSSEALYEEITERLGEANLEQLYALLETVRLQLSSNEKATRADFE